MDLSKVSPKFLYSHELSRQPMRRAGTSLAVLMPNKQISLLVWDNNQRTNTVPCNLSLSYKDVPVGSNLNSIFNMLKKEF